MSGLLRGLCHICDSLLFRAASGELVFVGRAGCVGHVCGLVGALWCVVFGRVSGVGGEVWFLYRGGCVWLKGSVGRGS